MVSVEIASDHEEYGAYTLRPKICKMLKYFMQPVEEIEPEFSFLYNGLVDSDQNGSQFKVYLLTIG